MSEINMPLLAETLDYIAAHPGRWVQPSQLIGSVYARPVFELLGPEPDGPTWEHRAARWPVPNDSHNLDHLGDPR